MGKIVAKLRAVVEMADQEAYEGRRWVHGARSCPMEPWKLADYTGSTHTVQTANASSNFKVAPIINREVWSTRSYCHSRESQYGPNMSEEYKWTRPGFPITDGQLAGGGRVPDLMAFEEFTKSSGYEGTQLQGSHGPAPYWKMNYKQRHSNFSTGQAHELAEGEHPPCMRFYRPPQAGQDQRGNTDPHMALYKPF